MSDADIQSGDDATDDEEYRDGATDADAEYRDDAEWGHDDLAVSKDPVPRTIRLGGEDRDFLILEASEDVALDDVEDDEAVAEFLHQHVLEPTWIGGEHKGKAADYAYVRGGVTPRQVNEWRKGTAMKILQEITPELLDEGNLL